VPTNPAAVIVFMANGPYRVYITVIIKMNDSSEQMKVT
jgi:hypothetical protein